MVPMADLRYRTARNEADRLGQVSTPHHIAELLAQSVNVERSRPIHVLDLGAGQGALAQAILTKFQRSTATLVEFDREYVAALLRGASSRTQVLQGDVLDRQWDCTPPPSVIVSNPPYGTLIASEALQSVIKDANLAVPLNGKWVRGDAAFTARAWSIAGIGTHLGLIVASPLIRNGTYRPMRERLIKELRNLCVTQLDPLTFRNAEVSAFLLTGERGLRRKRNVILRRASSAGEILEEIEVAQEAALASLDIDYHLLLRRFGLHGASLTETLGSVGTVINRGSRSHQEFKKVGLTAFHTSDFPKDHGQVVLLGSEHSAYHVAKPGDILIPRVGSRCLTRQVRVYRGSGLFTDCVYRLSVHARTRSRVWNTLNSSFGEEWRLAHADGSCAKHLPVGTLLRMPLVG